MYILVCFEFSLWLAIAFQ